jgi:hypothetical protein
LATCCRGKPSPVLASIDHGWLLRPSDVPLSGSARRRARSCSR